MNKETLVRFINKYHLGGIVDNAVWNLKNGVLQTATMTNTRKLFAAVKWKEFVELGDATLELGIPDTKIMLRGLRTFQSDYIRLVSAALIPDGLETLTFSDDKRQFCYATCNLDVIDPVPRIKNIPNWDVAIRVTDCFKEWFFSTYSAVGDKSSLFGVELVDGSIRVSINGCSMECETLDELDEIESATHFSALHLQKILKANSEFRQSVLFVSSAGLCHIKFTETELESEYYMVKIDVED